ncbi:polysaccharide deacetylase family protein [[Clostridium] hylemonae]|uniref:Polysaccharide deacetylase n=1 Tax=[Clostridium] hylemonae DSM 15053 TaxID=553973 RepID=C0BZY6_9FIRM|nr:polysaccharide deacetylase family protein [[Clostridium] hylemonae]EEG74714.1 polysaccharide deacetylase [[Clostridium] hylemonae DSM 15053]QEK18733.1 Peptidoglycan-N-acetylmuramic acid deacetylase PdaA [[Clostridium] hylemonae DSM 15053]
MMWMIAATAVLAIIVLSYSVFPSFALRYVQTWKRKRAGSGRVLYLTFDDGPGGSDTEALLDLLKKYEIKASFFTVAESAGKYPSLIARMKEEGHLIGLHSVHHNNALFRGNRFTYTDLAQSMFALQKLGCDAVYYRPPWGHLNLFTLGWLKRLNLRLIFWDVMAQDWSEKETADTICLKIMRRVFPGAVICLHDGRGAAGAPARTVDALRQALPMLLQEGYTFKRVDDNE